MAACQVSFPNADYSPVVTEAGAPLSSMLTLQNSPILFGCRTGICGTCLVMAKGEMAAATEDEQEVLDILAPESPTARFTEKGTARLACQIMTSGDIAIAPIPEQAANP